MGQAQDNNVNGDTKLNVLFLSGWGKTHTQYKGKKYASLTAAEQYEVDAAYTKEMAARKVGDEQPAKS